MSDPPTLSILIANWNGEAFIERALGSVLAAARRAGGQAEVIVYDDASEDRSPEIIERQFPAVRLIRGERNLGYGEAVNRAMQTSRSEWVVLLNNDLALRADFIERLLTTRDADGRNDLFAIGARTLDWETGEINHGGQNAAWRGGMLVQDPFESDTAVPTDFFQAGACLIHRQRFLAIGGFAALFHPGYWEDYDLAWQARERGWRMLYEPRAIAYHCGKGSMRRRFGAWGVSLMLRRNHLLFNWVNLRGGNRLAAHLFALPHLIVADDTPDGEAGWGRAWLAALSRLPSVLAERRRRLSAIR